MSSLKCIKFTKLIKFNQKFNKINKQKWSSILMYVLFKESNNISS